MSKIIVRKQEYANNGTHADEIKAVVRDDLVVNTLSSATDLVPSVGLVKSETDAIKESLSTLVKTETVIAESVTVPHGDYLYLNDYRPTDRTNYTWHLIGALPSTGDIQITGMDGMANRVMTLTESKASVSNSRLVLTWFGIHK